MSGKTSHKEGKRWLNDGALPPFGIHTHGFTPRQNKDRRGTGRPRDNPDSTNTSFRGGDFFEGEPS